MSEAFTTNVEDLGLERGHRTLRIVGKGNKSATIPLVPRTARTIALAIAARHADPRTTTIDDRPRQNFDRYAAYVVVAFVAGG